MTENYSQLSEVRGDREFYELLPAEQFAYEQAALLGFDAGFLPVSWTRKPQHQFITDLLAVQAQVEERLVAQSRQDKESIEQCEAPPSIVQEYNSLLLKLIKLERNDFLQSGPFYAALRDEYDRHQRRTTQVPVITKTWNTLKTHRKFALVRLNPECAVFVTRAPIVLHGLSQANIGHWIVNFHFAEPIHTLRLLQVYGDEERGHPHIYGAHMCFGSGSARAEQLCLAARGSTAKMKALLSFVHNRLRMHTDGEYTLGQRRASLRERGLLYGAPDYVKRYRDTLQAVLQQNGPSKAPARKKGRRRAK